MRYSKKVIVKRQPYGRIIISKTFRRGNREYTYHATKGWRSCRV